MFDVNVIINLLKKLIYILALVCFAVLAVTGFIPWLLGKSLSGYLLMIHATFAPVFALCMAVLAVMEAHNQRFDKSDWLFLLRMVRLKTPDEGPVSNGSVLVMKVCFWLICVLAVPLFLSSVLSMFPLFGTAGQKFLFHLHRYGALLFALAAIVYICLSIRKRAAK